MVEIESKDLPKSGSAMAPPAPQGKTGLGDASEKTGSNEESLNVSSEQCTSEHDLANGGHYSKLDHDVHNRHD